MRAVLVGIGAVTALGGAIACFEQRHIKRLLAFATVSQVGAMVCGIGMLRDPALAGAAVTGVGFALTIAALFGAGGVLLRRYGSTDEFDLAGRGRDLPVTGVVFAVGALGLASLPPGASFYGRWLIDEGARDAGYGWLPLVLAVSAALTAGATLRVTARVFLGWGEREHCDAAVASEERSQEQSSAEEERDMGTGTRPAFVLAAVPLVLLAAAFVLGALPGFVSSVEAAAAHFRDVKSYLGVVLSGRAPHYAPVAAHGLDATAWVYAIGSLAAALAFAAFSLRGRRVVPEPLEDVLRAAHSGHIGDYVAWWTFGMTVLGGLMLWAVAG